MCELDESSDDLTTHFKANVTMSKITHSRFNPITFEFCIFFLIQPVYIWTIILKMDTETQLEGCLLVGNWERETAIYVSKIF